MFFLDAFFRFSGIGVLLLIAIFVIRDFRRWPSAPYLILSCISVSALFFGYAPVRIQPPEPFLSLFRFLDIPHLIFVWLFALSLFANNFSLRRVHVIVGMLYCVPIVWLRLGDITELPALPPWIYIYGSATSALLMMHLCFATLSERADDLLEKRRRARIYFVVMIVGVTLGAAFIDAFMQVTSAWDKKTLKMLVIWPAIIWGGFWLLLFNPRAANFSNLVLSEPDLDARDRALRERLMTVMTKEEAFKNAELTIGSLSARLGVSQHRLRELINTRLGYPNFSTFINTYRVQAVKRAFENPDMAHIPVLTIALDCGFKSLSPFNKAFKQTEGMTPTQFRKSLKK